MGENKSLLLKGAMNYGLTLGIFWVIKYLFFIFGGSMPTLSYVYILLTLAVPFVAYYLTKRYKDEIGGDISFFHAWRFGMMMYFFAALVVSLEHFIFYKFIASPDFLPSVLGQAADALKQANLDAKAIESMSKISFTPIHMAIQGIFNNIFYGIVFSIPVAAFLCRKNTSDTMTMHQSDEE